MMLEVDRLAVRFGGNVAIEGVSFVVQPGDCVSIIGPNGAGKSTLLNVLSGLVNPYQGRVTFKGRDLLRERPHARPRLGIARTFQHSELFPGLTVLDQLLSGASGRLRYGLPASLLRLPRFLAAERDVADRARSMLERLGLTAFANRGVTELPGPTRRLVDLGRALMMEPSLVLLDEVGAGLTEGEKATLAAILKEEHRRTGMAMLLIEHDLQFVRALTQTSVVLAHGRLLAAGPTEEVLRRAEVLAAYVGVERGAGLD